MFSFFKRAFALAVSFVVSFCIITFVEILADESVLASGDFSHSESEKNSHF